MNDLREKVEKERSLLKKIELAIPGFRGYRKREDIRIADSMVRDYVSRILEDVEKYAKETRENITNNMMLDVMGDIGKIVNYVSRLTTEIRHAEQGYMGLAGDYHVDVEQLNRLYEFDVSLINKAKDLLEFARKTADTHEEGALRTMIREFINKLNELDETFRRRRDYMLEVLK